MLIIMNLLIIHKIYPFKKKYFSLKNLQFKKILLKLFVCLLCLIFIIGIIINYINYYYPFFKQGSMCNNIEYMMTFVWSTVICFIII